MTFSIEQSIVPSLRLSREIFKYHFFIDFIYSFGQCFSGFYRHYVQPPLSGYFGKKK
jgi:hypothetical protein